MLAGLAPASAASLPISQKSLIGTWECGPTIMKGPHAVMSVVSITTFADDNSFVGKSSNVIAPPGSSAFTVTNSARGTWQLEGTALTWVYLESKFISSSDPRISVESGQKVEDDEMRKKSVFKSKILEITHDTLRRIPIDSAHPEAVVEAKCKRILAKY
jgi:hypothetical protein